MPEPPAKLKSHLSMFVLDVMRWADSFDAIFSVINDDGTMGWRDVWHRAFEPSEIDSALEELKEQGLIRERDKPDYYDITQIGSRAWERWIPPGEAGERVIISRILLVWDPIGVFQIDDDWPQDEYESYVPRIIAVLREGIGEQALAEMLQDYRVEYMGLSPNIEKDAEIAGQICEQWARHRAAWTEERD